ncbi:hypothetical protein ACFL6Y_10815 [Elusimicrobiota bacterium]
MTGSMIKKFRKALEKAQGRSEFVIAVMCDIRGFSEFSTTHESPDTAMFIKRIYIQLIDKYFSGAHFVKPTGDGLMLIFKYTEGSLLEVSKEVMHACFRCMKEFPGICKDDPMINFKTPPLIAFGISRGPACCLYSGKQLLDYAGHLLNLATRLMDLARPSGIVIDGQYLKNVIPTRLQNRFIEKGVYIRGIAEEEPHPVFYSKSEVKLPEIALVPLKSYKWSRIEKLLKLKDLKMLTGNFIIRLPTKAHLPIKIKAEYCYPNPEVKRYLVYENCGAIQYYDDASGPRVTFSLSPIKENLSALQLPDISPVKFIVNYVPK